jgi:hypothetical protein
MTVTADNVTDWITSSSGTTVALSADDTALLEQVVSAVTVHVAHTYTYAGDTMPDDYTQAIVMQSARLWERRNTPNGVAGFGEFGAVRVSRLDPDVAALLGPYEVPEFG